MRAAEYIPKAILAATGISAVASRFGGTTTVSQTRDASGKVQQYVTTRGVDPVLAADKAEVRWTIEGSDRVDTVDLDVFNVAGQVHVSIEAYSPQYEGACNLIDDILTYINRDGVLTQVIAQHDEDVAPGRESELYAHVALISIPGGGLPDVPAP